jgi:hypothetical protein
MTVIDYTGTLKLNDNAKQGIMAAQEENANNDKNGITPTDEDESLTCSQITSVNENDCARFKLINDIR